jgi:tetratricopeptide (TPR) repeat protein
VAHSSTRLQGGARSAGPLTEDRTTRAGARGRLLATLAITAIVGLLLGRFLVAGGDPRGAPPPAALPVAGSGTQATVARLQDQLRASPEEPRLLTRLGTAYLARARETADPSYYAKAGETLERSHRLAPGQSETMTALGLLDLARHDFAGALAWGRQAERANPEGVEALGVIVDAQVELGRYTQAVASAQRMVDRKPNLASLARIAYLRELHGDTQGAIVAMGQAVTAGAGSPGDLAAVRCLLGDLQLGSGALQAAEAAYRRALADQPGYGPAEAGLARVAAARGDLAGAAARLAPVVARLPEPDSVALLGDLYAALGRRDQATHQYQLVGAVEALNQANGVAVDLELARFAADHARERGAEPARAVTLARRAQAERPTIYAADTLGWALRQAGRAREALPHARAAVRLGTQDAVFWYHLAAIEADLGFKEPARRHLARAFAINPTLTVRDLSAARSLADRLGVPTPAPTAAR